MFNFFNSSVIYVSQIHGDDFIFNGLSPHKDDYGNGPFKTLGKAISAVGELRVTGYLRPVTISLVDDYYVSEPISLNCDSSVHKDNHSLSSLTIESFADRKRIIGGVRLENWKWDTFNGVKCISVSLPDNVISSKSNISDLFINGKRANNTRYPENGTLKAVETDNGFSKLEDVKFKSHGKWFIADKRDLENLSSIEDATVSYYHYWIDEHSEIESYDKESGKIIMKYPSVFAISTVYSPEEHTSALKYYLENIPECFKNPNEWYFDRKNNIIYYIPDIEDFDINEVDAYIPTVQKIIDFKGTLDNRIKDIRIRNLELLCTSSNYVSKYAINPETGVFEYNNDPNFGYASDIQSVCYAHGAVSFENADRCSVTDCLIHHIGTHGVEIKNGCFGIRVENNFFDDMGAGGVRVFGGAAGCDEKEITSNCVIRGNKILNCGIRLAAACGVLLCHASNNEISDNEIAYLDYTGISVGWVWGYNDSTTFGNIVRNNHIHHIGQGRLSDMGGIYLLGKQQGTVVSYNRIHDVSSAHYGGWGIYTDEGSSYITIENNVVYNTKCESFHQHYGSFNTVRNNIFVLGSGCIRVSQQELHDCCYFENNILVTDGKPIYGEMSRASSIMSKCNIIYDISKNTPVLYRDRNGNEFDFDKWLSCARDFGSIISNPIFENFNEYDFTLKKESPAIALGFKPIEGFTASGK